MDTARTILTFFFVVITIILSAISILIIIVADDIIVIIIVFLFALLCRSCHYYYHHNLFYYDLCHNYDIRYNLRSFPAARITGTARRSQSPVDGTSVVPGRRLDPRGN